MNAPGYIIEWMARNQWRNGTYFVKKYLNGQEKRKRKDPGLATYVEDIICTEYINMFLR
jgi:hypothetical protein